MNQNYVPINYYSLIFVMLFYKQGGGRMYIIQNKITVDNLRVLHHNIIPLII